LAWAGASLWAAEATEPSPQLTIVPPEDVGEATSILLDAVENLVEGFIRSLPLIAIGLLVVAVGVLLARGVGRLTARGLQRASGDQVVVGLGVRLARLFVVTATLLLALSVAGVPVGAALAGFGIAGLAVAFALQSILENFVAGILLMIRKPISHGEQVRINDHEGTVDDIDLRVTRLVDYDGEQVIIPNGEVFRSTIVNLTRRGKRRTRVVVGIDYRDDHDAVGPLLEEVVAGVVGVLPSPAPQVRCIALGESSVDFEVRYWTAPDIASVVDAQDRVLRAVKSAVAEAGMTIPWPIRTLSFDNTLATSSPDGRARAEEVS
jgi:small conductance mechanosensitive channel